MPVPSLTEASCMDYANPALDMQTVSGSQGQPPSTDDTTNLMLCQECETYSVTTHPTVYGTRRCGRCLVGWQRCSGCRDYTNRARLVVDGDGICDECAIGHPTCDDCGTLAVERSEVQGGDQVCSRCRTNDYHECLDCFTVVPVADDYCHSCRIHRAPALHAPSYKPCLIFYGSGPLYLGMELELKALGNGMCRDAVDAVWDHIGGLAYLKSEDSVDCGFELVTHPMSYSYACEEFPWPLLDQLRDLGCYTDPDVGIHVHLSRAGFSGAAHIYRWLKFIYRNEAAVTRLARRRSESWASFHPETRRQARLHAKGSHAGGHRYQAINVNPAHTFELRVFASSLHPQQVQAALAFADASVEYTRTLRAVDVARRRGWDWDIFTAWVDARPRYAPLTAELGVLACAS